MDVYQLKLSDHGISASTNISKLSVAGLIRKMFILFYLYLGEIIVLEIDLDQRLLHIT